MKLGYLNLLWWNAVSFTSTFHASSNWRIWFREYFETIIASFFSNQPIRAILMSLLPFFSFNFSPMFDLMQFFIQHVWTEYQCLFVFDDLLWSLLELLLRKLLEKFIFLSFQILFLQNLLLLLIINFLHFLFPESFSLLNSHLHELLFDEFLL